MHPKISINVLAQSVSDRMNLFTVLDTLKPSVTLVMDDVPLAKAIHERYPSSIVIHRSWHPSDAELHHLISPDQFVRDFCNVPHGIAVQCLNEPQSYVDMRPLAAWCANVVSIAAARGVRIAVPNFGMGHPDEQRVRNGELDVLLKAVARHNALFAVHEYFNDNPAAEPWHITRLRVLHERCITLGIAAPQFVITEAGRDVGGGHDGWRTVFSEEAYADKLIQQAKLYAPYNVAGITVFCYGKGGGDRWHTFNVEGASTLIWKLAVYNREVEMTQTIPVPTTGGKRGVISKMPKGADGSVNMRTSPSGSAIGQVDLNEEITFFPNAPSGDWIYVVKDNGVKGWVSRQSGAVVFTEEAPYVPPINEDGLVKLSVADFNATLADMEVIAQRMQAIQNRLDPYVPG